MHRRAPRPRFPRRFAFRETRISPTRQFLQGAAAAGAVDGVLAALSFDRDGLIAAVAQQHDTGEVLMLAWMNRQAIDETLKSGQVCYWSRSRNALWRRGETSGQAQSLVELRIDCDNDCLLLLVDQSGVACHTGRRSCFFTAIRAGEVKTIGAVLVDPAQLYAAR